MKSAAYIAAAIILAATALALIVAGNELAASLMWPAETLKLCK
jgi:hypothetical protein